MDEPPGYREQKVAARLRVVEALLWTSANADAVLAISRSAETRDDAVRLLGTEHGFDEFLAHHILDVPFGRLTRGTIAALRDEAQRLRRGEDTSSPPPSFLHEDMDVAHVVESEEDEV